MADIEKGKFVIFITLFRAAALRDIVLNGVLAEIKRQKPNVRFVVLTDFPLIPDVKKFFIGLDVTFEKLEPFKYGMNKETFFFKSLRSFLYACYNDLDTSDVKINIERYGTYGAKKPYAFYLFKAIKLFDCRPTRKLLLGIRRCLIWLESAITRKKDERYKTLFTRHNPKMIYCYSPYDMANIPVQREARRLKVPMIAEILSWDNTTTSGELTVPLDKMIVWSENMKQEAIDYLKYRPNQLLIGGALQFDHYFRMGGMSRENLCKRFNIPLGKKIITYTASSPLHFPRENEVIFNIAKLVKEKFPEYHLVARLYPNLSDISKFEYLEKEGLCSIDNPVKEGLGSETYIPDEQYLRNLIELVKYSDIIINYPSTIILDAAIFRKPCITLKFDPEKEGNIYLSAKRFFKYTHVQYITDSKCTFVADNYADVEDAIRALASDPHVKDKKIEDFQRKICGLVDGKVYSRVAALIVAEISDIEKKMEKVNAHENR
jgi:CDP-glycerol glycerophosphotransferase (TagB/SpsB family)